MLVVCGSKYLNYYYCSHVDTTYLGKLVEVGVRGCDWERSVEYDIDQHLFYKVVTTKKKKQSLNKSAKKKKQKAKTKTPKPK